MYYPNDEAEKKAHFDAIGEAIVANTQERSSIAKIFLDVFRTAEGAEVEYIVLHWNNGGVEVRNATGNSLNADIQEASKLLNGGYYGEVDRYTELKKQ